MVLRIGFILETKNFPSKSLDTVLKKLSLTQQKQTAQEQNQHSSLTTVHMCMYHCAQLLYTTQHRTVLIMFPLSGSYGSSGSLPSVDYALILECALWG